MCFRNNQPNSNAYISENNLKVKKENWKRPSRDTRQVFIPHVASYKLEVIR
jgi:hypothetical protein